MPEHHENRAPIAVVHLVRAKNGLKPFERFLRSYQQHPAGLSHDLTIVYKGFSARVQIEPWKRLLRDVPHQIIHIPDIGFDLRAYRVAVERLQNPFLFCLNSFSVILGDGWLEKAYTPMRQQGIGIVGATGSWESMLTNARVDYTQLRHSDFFKRLTGLLRLKACQMCFEPFPNYHIRTTAFMMAREVMLALWPRLVLTKRGAYLFENGKNSLTKQLFRRGLRPLVVGRDGRDFAAKDWISSNTFRNGNQSNLLVADNQTKVFQEADTHVRARLTRRAWGV